MREQVATQKGRSKSSHEEIYNTWLFVLLLCATEEEGYSVTMTVFSRGGSRGRESRAHAISTIAFASYKSVFHS